MTLDDLTSERHAALAHLNLCRRLRYLASADISVANQHGEPVHRRTLAIWDALSDEEADAVSMYSTACKAVDDHMAELAGLITQEPQP